MIRFGRSTLVVAVASWLFVGCASHQDGGILPIGQTPNAQSAATLRSPAQALYPDEHGASADVRIGMKLQGKGLDLTRFYPKLRHPGRTMPSIANVAPRTITQLEIKGYIYPSYASPQYVYNDVKVNAPKGKVASASIPFSNVPVGNNEWAILYLYGVAADGSDYYLGALATMLNVSATTSAAIASNDSTLVWQAEMAMIVGGQFSASDLKSLSTLSKTVTNEIAAQHLKPRKTTGLFSAQQLYQFVETWMPAWRRQLVITPDNGAWYVTLANDVTDPSDNVLYYNSAFTPMTNSGAIEDLRPFGAPCSAYPPYGTPSKSPKLIVTSCANYWYGPATAGGGSLALNVYGGPMYVGQVNYTSPYTASLQKVSNLAAGSKTNLSLGALQPAQRNLAVNDPQDWAFQSFPELTQQVSPEASLRVSPAAWEFFDWYAPAGWSQSSPDLGIVAWNPWKLPLAALQICSWQNTCQAANSNSVLAIHPPFQDWGSNLAYYGWTVSNGGSSIAAASGCGYRVTYAGTAFTISSNTATWLQPDQHLQFYFNTSGGCNVPPANTRITVVATGSDGNTYTNYGTYSGPSYQYADLYMNAVTRDTPITSMSITFSGLTGTTADLYYIYSSTSISDVVHAGRRLAVKQRSK